MRIVVALGGSALLHPGESPDAEVQRRNLAAAAAALAPLTRDHEVVICHDNRPQVGLLAAESESDDALARPYPLDALAAQTQGLVGYWLATALRNAGVTRPVAALVTQTVVDDADPAFAAPSAFVGPGHHWVRSRLLTRELGWTMGEDEGRRGVARWRRAVPSPRPVRIVELPAVLALVRAGVVVVCCGGGGAPVTENGSGQFRGADVVVDKDLTAALLAVELRAEALLLLTDVDGVLQHFGTPRERRIPRLNLEAARALRLPATSMGPKVAACVRFVDSTGGFAAIGALEDAGRLLDDSAGTVVEGVHIDPCTEFPVDDRRLHTGGPPAAEVL